MQALNSEDNEKVLRNKSDKQKVIDLVSCVIVSANVSQGFLY